MDGNAFDYVIVGAGSAGCVLASRLSEDPSNSVLLIEAGGSSTHPLARMPIAIPFFFSDPQLNWNYESEPEAGLDGRTMALPRGRVLGGCSTINGMTYARGHRSDYNDWEAAGAKGWSYADVLPYFRKLESSWLADETYHGHSGPIGVQPADHASLLLEELREAAAAMGIPATADYHGAQSEGVARQELTTVRGRRASTAHAYLAPALKRPNLSVLTNTQVDGVVIEGGKATGVAIRGPSGASAVRTAHEVILSAGSYNSPKLLMLSGIGPGRHLRDAGIEVRLDLPGVGANLTEHPLCLMDFHTDPGTFTDNLRFDRATLAALRWFVCGNGAFATNGCSANIFAKSRPQEDRPDLQLMCMALSLGAALWPPFGERPDDIVGTYVTVLRPKSRGNLSLASPDPAAAPKVRLNLFEDEDDMRCMLRGMRLTRSIYGQEPFRSRHTIERTPGAQVSSDDALAAYVRANVQLGHHPVSTCRMGEDPMAVVDSELRVRGVAGLRVIDASVMPTIPGGNTNVPTIMIGEKGADLIRRAG